MTKFYREQKVELFYFTDPLCLHCWDFEPYLNKILQLYVNYVDLHILMGKFPEESLGKDPLFPLKQDLEGRKRQLPAKVFRVFTSYAPKKAQLFLRLLRQAAFVDKEDVYEANLLISLMESLDEPGKEILSMARGEEGAKRLEEDLRLARRFSIQEIPTMVMVHGGKQRKLVGISSEEALRRELVEILGHKPQKSGLRSLEEELKILKRLYPKDLEVLYNLNPEEMRDYVEGTLEEGNHAWVKYNGGGYYLEAR